MYRTSHFVVALILVPLYSGSGHADDPVKDLAEVLVSGQWVKDYGENPLLLSRHVYAFTKDGHYTYKHETDYNTPTVTGRWELAAGKEGKVLLRLKYEKGRKEHYWLPEESTIRYDAKKDVLLVSGKLFFGEQTLQHVKVPPKPGDKIKPKDEPGSAKNWIKSKDGVLGFNLHPKIESMTRNDGFVMVAFVRNFSDKEIYVFKPFSGPFVGTPPGLEVVGPKGKAKYVGPAVQPRSYRPSDFIHLYPGETLEDEVWLDPSILAGVDDPGEYSIRFKYATADIQAKDVRENFWKGTIEADAKAKRTMDASPPPKDSTEITVTKTSFRFDPKTCVRGSAWVLVGGGLGAEYVNVLGREGDYCVFDYTLEGEGDTSTYRLRAHVDGRPVISTSPTSLSLKDAHVLSRGYDLKGAKDGGLIWHQRGVPKSDYVNYYADLTNGGGATAEAGSRVKIRYTVFPNKRFNSPLPGAAGKTMEFQLDDAEPGLREAVRGMKVGGRRALWMQEKVIPALAKSVGIQAGYSVSMQIELLEAK